MEQQFRKLALAEAKGTLSKEDAGRLEELTAWREQLVGPTDA